MTADEEKIIEGVQEIYEDCFEELEHNDLFVDDNLCEYTQCAAIDYLRGHGLNTYDDKHARELLNEGKRRACKNYDINPEDF